VPAYSGCLGKEAVKWVSVSLLLGHFWKFWTIIISKSDKYYSHPKVTLSKCTAANCDNSLLQQEW